MRRRAVSPPVIRRASMLIRCCCLFYGKSPVLIDEEKIYTTDRPDYADGNQRECTISAVFMRTVCLLRSLRAFEPAVGSEQRDRVLHWFSWRVRTSGDPRFLTPPGLHHAGVVGQILDRGSQLRIASPLSIKRRTSASIIGLISVKSYAHRHQSFGGLRHQALDDLRAAARRRYAPRGSKSRTSRASCANSDSLT